MSVEGLCHVTQKKCGTVEFRLGSSKVVNPSQRVKDVRVN
jgi:hypothetical protein